MPEPSDLRNLLAEATTASEAAEKPMQNEKPEAAVGVPEKAETPSGDRLRGPDGKFLAKDASEDPEAEPLESGEEDETEEETPVKVAIEVPQHWSQADKDLITALPPEHRAKVVERYKAIEAGFTPKLQRAAELEKQFGGAQEVFAPYAEVLRQRNQTPSDIVKVWASVEQGFIEGFKDASEGRPNDKGAQLIANLIRGYKVDPGAVAAILQGQRPTASATPNEQVERNTIAIPPEFVRRLDTLEQRENDRIQRMQTEQVAAAQRQIDAFAAEKDTEGKLTHPFFSELESDIMMLAQLERAQGKTLDLADLYDRALYANRETREKLLTSRDAEAKLKAAADRKARAAAAQRASSSVTGSSPRPGQTPSEHGKARSLREELETAAADQEAAV